MRTHRSRTPRSRLSHRQRLSLLALLVVVASLALTATVAVGLEPSPVSPIADSAFGPAVLASSGSTEALGLQPLADPLVETPPPARPQPSLPVSRPLVTRVAPKLAHSIVGRASWYCNADDPSGPMSICHRAYPDAPGFDAYAAAGPGLRAALGPGWRNTRIYVCGRVCIRVRLVDWCKCTGGSVGIVKLIDLYYDVYVRTGGNVTLRW